MESQFSKTVSRTNQNHLFTPSIHSLDEESQIEKSICCMILTGEINLWY